MNVQDILDTMDYGPAPESDSEARAWLAEDDDAFGQFINGDSHLVPVSLGSLGEASKSLEFFMGRNTPERRVFIMENLIHDAI